MIRKAFVMAVHPGMEGEYERRHNPIPADLGQALKAGGASNYSIFLDAETNRLFAYVEVEDDVCWNAIADTAACRCWWSSMRELMPTNLDDSPIATDLREIFHLD